MKPANWSSLFLDTTWYNQLYYGVDHFDPDSYRFRKPLIMDLSTHSNCKPQFPIIFAHIGKKHHDVLNVYVSHQVLIAVSRSINTLQESGYTYINIYNICVKHLCVSRSINKESGYTLQAQHPNMIFHGVLHHGIGFKRKITGKPLYGGFPK